MISSKREEEADANEGDWARCSPFIPCRSEMSLENEREEASPAFSLGMKYKATA